MTRTTPYIIDGLQYSRWSREVFKQMRQGGLDAVHVTISYHELFRETVANIEKWNRLFDDCDDLIMLGRLASDIEKAKKSQRIAVFFGLQNCSSIEDDIGLVEVCHSLGVRFMQLSYNNQSLLASGCYEEEDGGITRMGREVIEEMNRVGMVVDMSHSGERSSLQAIEISERPIAITHANPSFWHETPRSKSEPLLKALAAADGVIGFSLYPYHLLGHSTCSLSSFCQMVARCAEMIGGEHIAIGSDLCQGQPDEELQWMRKGRWSKQQDELPKFPEQPEWFRDNRDFPKIVAGLLEVGFSQTEVEKIIGGNWLSFFEKSFTPQRIT